MAHKLKSKTGCITCRTRKKKCDEAYPACGTCLRLQLSCVWSTDRSKSGSPTAVSMTSLKVSAPRRAISSGYASFSSDYEQMVVVNSPSVLLPLISVMASPEFKTVELIGTFCAQNRSVRAAIVAFAVIGPQPKADDSFKLSLTSYQRCIAELRQPKVLHEATPAAQDFVLTSITFLGLLEALKFGDSTNAITHFDMGKKLLTAKLEQPGALDDPRLVRLYRIIAECIIFNLATLSISSGYAGKPIEDWGTAFDCLFPPSQPRLSPFLGGVHIVYQLMFQINQLSRRLRNRDSTSGDTEECLEYTVRNIQQQLDELEDESSVLYSDESAHDSAAAILYQSKLRISVAALNIQLFKVWDVSLRPSHARVRRHFQCAKAILEIQEIREPGNPALRWPLTVLASAAHDSTDFEFILQKMSELESVIDLGNGRRLANARKVLRACRDDDLKAVGVAPNELEPKQMSTQFDALLDQQRLDGY